MGAWGPALYSDDDALDFKEIYDDLLKKTQSHEEAYRAIYEESKNDFVTMPEIEAIFWFVIAERQWFYGKLLPEVKVKAIEFFDRDEHLEVWKENNGIKLFDKRVKVLKNLKQKINSPLPPERKLPMQNLPVTAEPGDLFTFKLSRFRKLLFFADIADISVIKEKYTGKYVVFQYLGVEKFLKDDIVLIRIYDWCRNRIPNQNEIENLKFIPNFDSLILEYGINGLTIDTKIDNGMDVNFLDAWEKRFVRISHMPVRDFILHSNNDLFAVDIALAYMHYKLEKNCADYEILMKLINN